MEIRFIVTHRIEVNGLLNCDMNGDVDLYSGINEIHFHVIFFKKIEHFIIFTGSAPLL
jgi:hypothetical protein